MASRSEREAPTRRLLLTGATISAAEAQQIGLINKAVPDERFEEEIAETIKTLSALSSPVLRLNKKAVMDVLELDSQVFEDRLAAYHNGDVLQHGLSAVAVTGRFDGGTLERATQLVDDHRRQRFAVKGQGWLLVTRAPELVLVSQFLPASSRRIPVFSVRLVHVTHPSMLPPRLFRATGGHIAST